MSTLRNQQYMDAHPCSFKIKEFEKTGPTGIEKVKQIIQKLDENGNPIFKTVPINQVNSSGGCSCKNKNVSSTPQQTTQIPDTVEIWVDKPLTSEDNKMVLCKLYGAVKRSHCLNCKSYKASK